MKRKIIGAFALILCAMITVFCLTACGGNSGSGSKADDTTAATEATTEEPKSPLIGTWENSKEDSVFTFNPDGTGTYSMGENSLKFTFEDKGSTMVVKIDSIGTQNVKYSIEGNKLSMTDEAGVSVEFTKK